MISSVNASLEARRTRGAESSPRPAACYDSRRYCTMVMRLVVDMFALSVALSAHGEGWRILRNTRLPGRPYDFFAKIKKWITDSPDMLSRRRHGQRGKRGAASAWL